MSIYRWAICKRRMKWARVLPQSILTGFALPCFLTLVLFGSLIFFANIFEFPVHKNFKYFKSHRDCDFSLEAYSPAIPASAPLPPGRYTFRRGRQTCSRRNISAAGFPRRSPNGCVALRQIDSAPPKRILRPEECRGIAGGWERGWRDRPRASFSGSSSGWRSEGGRDGLLSVFVGRRLVKDPLWWITGLERCRSENYSSELGALFAFPIGSRMASLFDQSFFEFSSWMSVWWKFNSFDGSLSVYGKYTESLLFV